MSTCSLNTSNYTTIEEYLRGCVAYDVAENAIKSILIDREVLPDTDVYDVEKRIKDLCRADLYMWCSNTPIIMGSVEDANGVWKHKEGGTQSSATEKRNLRAMANEIYKLYGENTVTSKIKIVSFGMSMTRKDR